MVFTRRQRLAPIDSSQCHVARMQNEVLLIILDLDLSSVMYEPGPSALRHRKTELKLVGRAWREGLSLQPS